MHVKRIIVNNVEVEVKVYDMVEPKAELNVRSTTKGKWRDKAGLYAYRKKETKADRQKLLNKGYILTNNY